MELSRRLIRNVVFECIDALQELEIDNQRLNIEITEYKNKMDEYISIINKLKVEINNE